MISKKHRIKQLEAEVEILRNTNKVRAETIARLSMTVHMGNELAESQLHVINLLSEKVLEYMAPPEEEVLSEVEDTDGEAEPVKPVGLRSVMTAVVEEIGDSVGFSIPEKAMVEAAMRTLDTAHMDPVEALTELIDEGPMSSAADAAARSAIARNADYIRAAYGEW